MSSTGTPSRQRGFAAAIFLIVSLFFLWGIANNLNDILIKQFKKAFTLSDFESGLVQSAFYLGYFVLAMPAAMFMQRFGYKAAVVLGLLLYGCGALLFYPAAELHEYAWFLGALFVIASGLAFLETSANPLMTMLGDPAGAERRLTFAQAFNPLGSIAGIVIGQHFILSGVEPSAAELAAMTPVQHAAFFEAEALAVQGPYLILGIGVIVWALLVLLVKFPDVAGDLQSDDSQQTRFRDLLHHRHLLFGVVAQFFYVGAQVGVWSYLIRYAQQEVPGMGEKAAASYLTWSLAAFLVGRFAGAALMGRIAADRLTAVYAAINIALALVAVFVGGHVGLWALVASSFFMSIMFPTVFALGIKGLGPLTKKGSSLIVMAIIGGALLTALMGQISDMSSIATAMLVPALCFAVVGAFALSGRGQTRSLPATAH